MVKNIDPIRKSHEKLPFPSLNRLSDGGLHRRRPSNIFGLLICERMGQEDETVRREEGGWWGWGRHMLTVVVRGEHSVGSEVPAKNRAEKFGRIGSVLAKKPIFQHRNLTHKHKTNK